MWQDNGHCPPYSVSWPLFLRYRIVAPHQYVLSKQWHSVLTTTVLLCTCTCSYFTVLCWRCDFVYIKCWFAHTFVVSSSSLVTMRSLCEVWTQYLSQAFLPIHVSWDSPAVWINYRSWWSVSIQCTSGHIQYYGCPVNHCPLMLYEAELFCMYVYICLTHSLCVYMYQDQLVTTAQAS